jgi:hypothetical protein
MAEKIASLYAEIGGDTSKLDKSLTTTKGHLVGFKDGLNNAIKGATGLNIASLSIVGSLVGVGAALKATMDKTVAYAKQVREIADFTGMGVTETSRLIQVADDWGIQAEQVRQSMQTMTKNGMAPGIESLAQLADEFVSTSDKTAFAEKAAKLLGRQWTTLIPLLKKGGDALRDQAAGVDKNLLMTEDMIKKAREYEVALDQWQEQSEKLVYHWGTALLPKGAAVLDLMTDLTSLNVPDWFNQGADAAADFINKFIYGKGPIEDNKAALLEWGEAGKEVSTSIDQVGQVVQENEHIFWAAAAAILNSGEAAKRASEDLYNLGIAEDELAAGLRGELLTATEDYTETLADLKWQEGELIKDIAEATRQHGGWSEEVADLTKKLDDNRVAQQGAGEALAETTKQMIYQQAAAGLDAEAALGLARSMGLISEADYSLSTVIQNLRKDFDKNQDGLIANAEGAVDFAGKVDEAAKVVDALQKQNLPLTLENISGAMKAVDQVGLGALSPDNLPLVLESIKANEQPAVTAMDNIQTEAEGIGTSITAAADVADTEFAQMQGSMETTVTSVDAVTTQVGILKSAIDALPTSKTITITLNTVDTGGASGTAHKPRASGGPVRADGLYLVGENGPELFIPNANGQIAPSSSGGAAVAMGGAADVYVVQNFYDQGAAALGMAYIESLRGKRLDASMGR